jgi:transcription-repair coupling factor (superfamily II helicase)
VNKEAVSERVLDLLRSAAEFQVAFAALDRPGAQLGGLWGGSFALFLAASRSEERADAGRGRPWLIVTPSADEADEIAAELDVFAPGCVRSFPPWESLFLKDEVPDAEVFRQRLALLEDLRAEAVAERFVVASVQALLQPVPSPDVLEQSRVRLELRGRYPPQELAALFLARGCRATSLVENPGEFSLRGDVLDVFPYSCELPLRLEFFDDVLESLRSFSPETQRSVEGSEPRSVDLLLVPLGDLYRDCFRGGEALLFDYLGEGAALLLKEPEEVRGRVEKVLRHHLAENAGGEGAEAVRGRFLDRLDRFQPAGASSLPLPLDRGAGGVNLGFGSVERFAGATLADLFSRIETRLAVCSVLRVYCESPAEARRFRDVLGDFGLASRPQVEVVVGDLRRGFEVPALGITVLTASELFSRRAVRRSRARSVPARAIQSFLELERGDFVVHLVHGIGRYLGIERYVKDGVEQEFLAVEYRDRVRIYVPVANVDLVQKYIGSGDAVPVLDRVGGKAWGRKKEAVEKAVLDLACELMELQALRQERPGTAYAEDSEWQRQFEAAFPYDDTPDQVEVTEAIKRDLESARPMDRLVCGDVGYGKTELAMRAAFKVVDAGKQVAVLVPTTVLAEQHFRTFRGRMAEFPVTIEVLNRFRGRAEQREIVERSAAGRVDILIGTHRLLSSDVAFRDLGLVVIDEEQRFGVVHKEALKKLRSQVDVLTLSATPIPRTLHMALLGIRDISSLTTAPQGRSPIHTEICHVDLRHVREIVLRELDRDGQVYFIHNRVRDIHVVAAQLADVLPEARIDVIHGQMNEHDLEDRMLRFLDRQTDVLIATTLIENGIDIPTVNTIIVNESDRYGLADLHQLRGRVGRYKHQAYCYLLLPTHRHVNADAQKRLQALVEFSGLGSGFQIAVRDLEIRGAGNLLGAEQSGHIAAVGYELYCRLLEKCVKKLKNEAYQEPVRVEVDLAIKAFLPDGFVRHEAEKLDLYRKAAVLLSQEAIDDFREELSDRFGALPPPVLRLLEVQSLRLRCAARGIEYVGRDEHMLILKGGEPMQTLVSSCPARVTVLDPKTVGISLREPGRILQPEIDDERLFDLLSQWLQSGCFPPHLARRRIDGPSVQAVGVAAGSSRRGIPGDRP